MDAIDRRDAIDVRAALESGVDPNVYPDTDADRFAEDDIRPINAAAYDGSVAIVKLLLDYGADPNLGDGWTYNPLAAATETESLDTMKLLIQRGAKVNDEEDESFSLWRAAMDGKVKSVAFPLDQGANPNTRIFTTRDESLIEALGEVGGSPQIIAMLRKRVATPVRNRPPG